MNTFNNDSQINEASIVDLKAELYKKELEAKQKGIGKQSHTVNHKKSKTLEKIALNTGKYINKLKKASPSLLSTPLTDQESEKLKHVTDCLDVKAKLYDKLKNEAKRGISHDKLNEIGILVDFDRKVIDEPDESPQESFFNIIQSAEADHRDKMNEKWEEERQRLKDKPIGQEHYQDVFFNELRQHGVGYYQFSSDEIERKKQLELLDKLRNETVGNRNKHLVVKAKRQQAMSERMEKIRQRRGLDSQPQIENITSEPITSEPKIVAEHSYNDCFNEIEELIKESKKQVYMNSLEDKLKVVEHETTEEERDEDFAPPQEYSIKNKPHSNYRRK